MRSSHVMKDVLTPREYYEFTHFTDATMTDQEIVELPKVWVVGGDGGIGDIGYQNTSKVILAESAKCEGADVGYAGVFKHRRGQNSDSTPMLGGNDMNVFGTATQGKNVEKKTVAETFLAGPRVTFRRADFNGQRTETLSCDFGWPGVPRDSIHSSLYYMPA